MLVLADVDWLVEDVEVERELEVLDVDMLELVEEVLVLWLVLVLELVEVVVAAAVLIVRIAA